MTNDTIFELNIKRNIIMQLYQNKCQMVSDYKNSNSNFYVDCDLQVGTID